MSIDLSEIIFIVRRIKRVNVINVLRSLWAGQRSRYTDGLRVGRSGDRIPLGARLSASVQTGPGTHSASCTMGSGSFPGGKERTGRDADSSPPSSAVIKKEQSCISTLPMGRTACTKPQCTLHFFLLRSSRKISVTLVGF